MNSFASLLRNLGTVRLIVMSVTVVAVVGLLTVFTGRFTQEPMTLLYGELDLAEASEIATRLDAMGVPYELTGNGTQVLVPADAALRMRMALAADGLPSGASIGYEIFDRGDALGTGRAIQDINLVRALEGELARTIRTFAQIQSARVHVVIPKRELFAQDKPSPSASIIVKVRGGATLSPGQVAAIQHVVAAAVPGLAPTSVSIADDRGVLLARGDGESDGVGASAAAANDARGQFEARLKRQIETLLEQSVGFGKVSAEVSAEIDFDRVTESAEVFDPDGQVVRSTQTVEDGATSSDSEAQPNVSIANELPEGQAEAAAAQSSRSNNRTEETVNYEISKTMKNHVREGGTIRRLSVAVLVDGTTTTAEDGTSAYQPRTPEELEQLAALVRSAVGFDADRGDVVEVVNMPFAANEELDLPEDDGPVLGLGKSDYMRIAEMAVMLVGVLLIALLVLRPLMAQAFRAQPVGAGAVGPGDGAPQLAGPGAQPAQIAGPASRADDESMIDVDQVEGRVRESAMKKVNEIVDNHPQETLNILRNWIYEET
ncbi:MAG: flagellar basal-body MS-ring/collar protein FliF [Alphaproteobacteria bacterium]